jgi:hypothetical protein
MSSEKKRYWQEMLKNMAKVLASIVLIFDVMLICTYDIRKESQWRTFLQFLPTHISRAVHMELQMDNPIILIRQI